MITKEQYLLIKLAEECAEIAQRATKALTFGLDEIQPGQDKSNRERLNDELIDLMAITDMAEEVGIFSHTTQFDINVGITRKIEKVEKYMKYSRELKILE